MHWDLRLGEFISLLDSADAREQGRWEAMATKRGFAMLDRCRCKWMFRDTNADCEGFQKMELPSQISVDQSQSNQYVINNLVGPVLQNLTSFAFFSRECRRHSILGP